MKNLENEEYKISKLKKLLYGLRQTGRQLYKKLDETLNNMKFKSRCVYMKRKNDELVLILVYVYDILIVSSDVKDSEEVKIEMPERFVVKDVGETNYCLRMEIKRNVGVIYHYHKLDA